MIRLDQGQALIALLALGGADLAALNHWALPGTRSVTEIDAATDGSRPPSPKLVATLPPSAAGPVTPAPDAREDPQLPAASPITSPPAAGARAVILFGRGTWWVGRRGRAALRESVAQLPQGQLVVEIDGHADATGPRVLNQRISEERAQAVAALMRRSGVAAAQIQLHAFGERRPSNVGSNRRVEIRIRGAP